MTTIVTNKISDELRTSTIQSLTLTIVSALLYLANGSDITFLSILAKTMLLLSTIINTTLLVALNTPWLQKVQGFETRLEIMNRYFIASCAFFALGVISQFFNWLLPCGWMNILFFGATFLITIYYLVELIYYIR